MWGSFIDQNFKLIATDKRQYVFKVHANNEYDSVLDMQSAVMTHLQSMLASVAVPRVFPTNCGDLSIHLPDEHGHQFTARLLSYLPGECSSNESSTA